MERVLRIAAVALVVFLFGVALFALASGRHAVAGVSFLSASVVIYLRETYLVDL